MISRFVAAAVVAAGAFGATSLIVPSDADARPKVVDHRPGYSHGGYAIPQKYKIKCVMPFCYHDFKPGPREQVRDHRKTPDYRDGPRNGPGNRR